MKNVITNESTLCTQALAALRHVLDPEIGLNIVDLGLIYQVDFDAAAHQVFVSMTLTTAFCPMGESIISSAERALRAAFPEETIHMEMVWDPRWSPKRISGEGQEFLNR